ncbi:hypothetical protein [Microlunatus ginsengisoli]|uniref:Uncharacterized protein n=1 Tax=Microlunatus ginsengisoli TaxID=363863 RepID=A0ABP6ZS92_9ACTN
MGAPREDDRAGDDRAGDDPAGDDRGRDDREAIDRAFAELVAHYHLTADRPDPLPPRTADPESPLRVEPEPPRVEPIQSWADRHPLFAGAEVPAKPEPEPDERYVPEPQPPMARPRLPILLAWAGIAFAAVVVLLAAFGIRLPSWTGWLAVGGFMGGFGVLVFHLPRSRPPGDDGAVV